MPNPLRTHCKIAKGGCGKSSDEVGPISWRGLCGVCGPRKAEQANDDLHYHRGPVFERWRRAHAAAVLPPDVMAALDSVGLFLLDETRDTE